MTSSLISPLASVSESAELADGVSVWHFAQIREDAKIGAGSIIGNSAYIGAGVKIGANCKIQNGVLLYEPAFLEDGVFVGPGSILTNDHFPRAINSDLTQKKAKDWSPVGVHVELGASIGANVVCVAPIRIGSWSMIGAGSIVTDDVQPFALMLGIPARQVGWVGKAGVRLIEENGNFFRCPISNSRYKLTKKHVLELME